VLLGSFARAGNLIRISARLQEATSGEILASETVEGQGEEAIFPLVDDLTKRIKAQFDMADEMMAADVDADLTDVTTDSLEAYRYYAEGIRLHEELREQEAIPLLEQAVEIDPDFAMALAKLATAYSNIGNIEMAKEYSTRAMDHLDRVTDRERYYIEGRHYSMEQETTEQSIEAYEKAVELYPDHTSARNNLAQQLLSLERFDEAIRHLEVLRGSGMQFPGTYSSLASAYGQMGQLEEGLEVLRQYTREHPDNAAGFENLASHLAWIGRHEDAERALDDAEALGRPANETMPLRWQIAVLDGDWGRAWELADRMKSAEEVRARGNGLLMAASLAAFDGDLETAFDNLDELERIPSMRVQSMNFRAGMLLDTGDVDGAAALAERQLAAAADDLQMRLDGLAGRALAVAARDGAAAAEDLVDELWNAVAGLGLPPRIIDREERRFRGQLAFYAGEWQEAVTLFSIALDRMPPRAQLGNSQRARIHHLLGVSYYELGDLDAAEGELQRALDAPGRVYEPIGTVRSHWYLGKIYEARGDTARARDHYRSFVERWAGGDIDQERIAAAETFLDR
jgi:pentatricopeptide repeat protein